MIVSNSSPLIYLSKIGKLSLLKELFNKIKIPKEVYNEVVLKGREGGFSDSYSVEKAVEDGWIEVISIKLDKQIEKFASEIDFGEVETISLALKLKAQLVIIDDSSARTIAESFGLNVKGTLYVLLRAYKKKFISKNDVKNNINSLIRLGFRISPELYGEILNELDE